jgi:hypothetical protein
MTQSSTKICKGCLEIKALSLFNKHKKMSDGHLNYCKVCHYEKNKANRLANPDSRKAEYIRLRNRKGSMTREEYLAKRKDNAKGKKAISKDYAIKHKDKLTAYRKQYEKDNKERIAARRAETLVERREVKRLWRKNNLPLVLADCAKRRASKLQRTPSWLTEFDLLKIKCYYQVAAMRTRESGENWHVDHIIPLQGKNVCGLHVPSNLQIIPAIENMRKNNHFEVL